MSNQMLSANRRLRVVVVGAGFGGLNLVKTPAPATVDIGARHKMVVYLNWVWAWLTYGSGARLMTGIDREDSER
jgi:hypothetical protein